MQMQLDFTQIGAEQIKEFEKHNKYDKADVEQHYDNVALNYEGVY